MVRTQILRSSRGVALLIAALCVLASGCIARLIGGDYHDSQPYAFIVAINAARNAGDPTVLLVRRARALLQSAERDGVHGAPHDHHFHLIGFATGTKLACADLLDPRDRAGLSQADRLPQLRFTEDNVWLHPDYHDVIGVRTVLRQALADANRIDDEDRANEQYLKRILDLVVAADLGGTYYLYALDYRFDREAREPNREHSDLYVSNDYAIAAATCLTQLAKHLA